MKNRLLLLFLLSSCLGQAQSTWKMVSLVTLTPDAAADDVVVFVTCGDDTIFYYDDFQVLDGQYAIGFTMPADRCCELHFRNAAGTGLGVGGSFLLYDVNEWMSIAASPASLTYAYDTPACACTVCVDPEPCPASTCPGDINADGIVNVADLSIFLSNYGNTCD